MTGKHDCKFTLKCSIWQENIFVRSLIYVKVYFDSLFLLPILFKGVYLFILEIPILFMIILAREQNQIHAFVMCIISDKIFGNLKWNNEILNFIFHVTTPCHNIWCNVRWSNLFLGSTSLMNKSFTLCNKWRPIVIRNCTYFLFHSKDK